MSNLINFLFFVVFFVFAAIDFGTAAKDFSNKRFYWFGFDLVIAIFCSLTHSTDLFHYKED